MEKYLRETPILNFSHPYVQKLLEQRGWMQLPFDDRKKAVYAFVRDEIKFGYNLNDSISASEVLSDGYGQCNTKGTLLMALFRAVGVPCRFHGFTIDKVMQKGAVTGIFYFLAPKEIIHSWVEVVDQNTDKVIKLEGYILDEKYMRALVRRLEPGQKSLCGFGASTSDLPAAISNWNGMSDTFIQNESIVKDFGVFESPDEFYRKYGTNLTGIKKLLFENWVRHRMNDNVERIRKIT